ncbi:MAG: hypothetical protein HGA27_01530 [Peptococcaceae bacterium]|nr:hypothetical protein [Peptococcaceae bacterium]
MGNSSDRYRDCWQEKNRLLDKMVEITEALEGLDLAVDYETALLRLGDRQEIINIINAVEQEMTELEKNNCTLKEGMPGENKQYRLKLELLKKTDDQQREEFERELSVLKHKLDRVHFGKQAIGAYGTRKKGSGPGSLFLDDKG